MKRKAEDEPLGSETHPAKQPFPERDTVPLPLIQENLSLLELETRGPKINLFSGPEARYRGQGGPWSPTAARNATRLDGHVPNIPISISSLSSTRSSSPSPQKQRGFLKQNDSTYRTNTLFRASIFIDAEMPRPVRELVSSVLDVSNSSPMETTDLASKLQRESIELAALQAGKAEWTEIFHDVIKDLKSPDLLSVRNRDWRGDVKPEVHQPADTVLPVWGESAPASSSGQHLGATFSLRNSRPDVSVGIADAALASVLRPARGDNARFFLNDLQDTEALISDPGLARLHLRFPFFVIEAKSGAAGGNLYQAQNQSAVSGASAINILKGVTELYELEYPKRHGGKEAHSTVDLPLLAFSMTTEGPVCEIWAHFWDPTRKGYCMTNMGIWRTTSEAGAREVVSRIARILRWGSGGLKHAITERLANLYKIWS
ncbi:hypothetical protein P170DRAFT_360518 [Aspergillus steynii IBT 23096]|uniref:DUF7924 domain-containing protein n=1 Tax=Aspergillus steynii IBT 23096 TaxID=1392250 RepID=A0A2I2G486_9EURO|nr:uncharacterized protein P170DRAFT_360518 [Aspergillus steynii IBT 23096]PLB47694.1 hypothetical protein P170DRAFT_360518 [Aspergillus steynii IBT 23096]